MMNPYIPPSEVQSRRVKLPRNRATRDTSTVVVLSLTGGPLSLGVS
jgi:hypothetical protein